MRQRPWKAGSFLNSRSNRHDEIDARTEIVFGVIPEPRDRLARLARPRLLAEADDGRLFAAESVPEKVVLLPGWPLRVLRDVVSD